MKWTRVRGENGRWEYVSGEYRIARRGHGGGWMVKEGGAWVRLYWRLDTAKRNIEWHSDQERRIREREGRVE